MGAIKVEIPEVQSLSVTTGQVASDLEAIVARLAADVQSIIGSTWIGADASSFFDEFARWRSGAQQVKVALGEIGTLLGRASATYDVTETTIAAQLAP